MRGFMRPASEVEEQKWCHFEYEFLLEFCYVCGIIGHDDKSCSVTLEKGERKQYGGWMRAYIPRKFNSGEKQYWGEGRSRFGGRGFGSFGHSSGGGSENPSWKKEVVGKIMSNNLNNRSSSSAEETSLVEDQGVQKILDLPAAEDSVQGGDGRRKDGTPVSSGATHNVESDSANKSPVDPGEKQLALVHGAHGVNPEAMHTLADHVEGGSGEVIKKKKEGSFKRRERKVEGNQTRLNMKLGENRDLVAMETDEDKGGQRRQRVMLTLKTKMWRDCRNSPAGPNEDSGSELPRAWEPAGS
jgi:hypothetical protein